MSTNNPILAIIHDTMQKEITNAMDTTAHSIIVTLPDQSQVIIGAILISAPQQTVSPSPLRTQQQHSYHFQHQSDTAQQTATPFTLQSVADCRSYVDDICQTMISAKFRDFEITLPDGSIYLVILSHKEKM